MKIKSRVVELVVVCLLSVMVLPILAEEGATKFTWGFIERLRDNYYNNITDYADYKNVKGKITGDDETHWIRVRTSLWGQVSYKQQLTLFAQLTNEFYPYITDPKDRDFSLDEIFFDNLYLKYIIGKTNPITLTLGRQNLIYGEGFLILDGAPWDGSRAIYHDAAKVSMKRGNTTVDLLGISNTKYELRLPVIRGKKLSDGELKGQSADQPMNDGLEQAFGIYATHKCEKLGQMDAYYIFKTEEPDPVKPLKDENKATYFPKDKLELNTLGARIAHPFNAKLSLTAEGAYQFGSQGEIDQQSYGGYGYLSYLLQKARNGKLSAGCYMLSGDDPDTKNNENWNPLFSRWPKWSELYIYSHLTEAIQGAARVAYWTNTMSPYVAYSLNLHKKVTLTTTYYHLNAMQARTLASGLSGKTRGDEVQVLFNFKWNAKMSSHFLFDYFMPGDFYAKPQADGMFVRAEFMYRM